LLRWLATRARLAATPLLLALSQQMDCRFARLQIRRQRTRWGSCSTRGTISLNCCLLFQRPQVLRYLLVHELSHVRHASWDTILVACGAFEPTAGTWIANWVRVATGAQWRCGWRDEMAAMGGKS
jgi:hypothetical protein